MTSSLKITSGLFGGSVGEIVVHLDFMLLPARSGGDLADRQCLSSLTAQVGFFSGWVNGWGVCFYPAQLVDWCQEGSYLLPSYASWRFEWWKINRCSDMLWWDPPSKTFWRKCRKSWEKHERIRTVLFCLGKSTILQNFLHSTRLEKDGVVQKIDGQSLRQRREQWQRGWVSCAFNLCSPNGTWQRWFPSRLVLRRKMFDPATFLGTGTSEKPPKKDPLNNAQDGF